MQPSPTNNEKYYKAFAQALRPALVQNLIDALDRGLCPELQITLEDGRKAAHAAGYEQFGSPQDFLYGFTSERYGNWSAALGTMGFKSAVMVGEQRAAVTMAPRHLDFGSPARVIDELSGAIALDYWETGALTGSHPELSEMLDDIYARYHFGTYVSVTSPSAVDADINVIKTNLAAVPPTDGNSTLLAELIKKNLNKIEAFPTDVERMRSYNKFLKLVRPSRPNERQEQIVLKYVQDGNFLQKLLGGRRVDHIQSNVKNQKNPLRGSGCEVDSIYRIVGDEAIVLVEAKVGNSISRSQLYQIYETYRLKLPRNWNIIVIAVLLTRRKADMPSTVRTVIDMAVVNFDDNALGRITESLINMNIGRHYRWLIHQD